MLSTFLTWIEYLSTMNTLRNPVVTNGHQIPQNCSYLWGIWTRYSTSTTPLTTSNGLDHIFSRSNATYSPLVTMGHPISTQKLPFSVGRSLPPSTLHIHGPTRLTTLNSIIIHPADFLHFTFCILISQCNVLAYNCLLEILLLILLCCDKFNIP